MASPRASSAPPPANAAPLASGANDGDADAPPMRRIERDDPQVTLAYPLFRFASAQASEQLAATFERDALQREASFLRLHRGRPAAELDGRAAYVRYACRATLAKPSIASVACTEVMELGAIAATRESGSTWLVDGAAVKPLVVRDLFRANANANAAAGAPAERGYVARVRGAINEVRAGCAMPLVDDRSFERALGGVSVDAEELTVYVTASSGCSARGYAARLRWRDIEAELDPAGPYRRIVKS